MLEARGIACLRLPMLTWDISADHVVAALLAIRAAERKGAVLIHCQHGADRTGVIAAMYRLVFQGWSKQQALAELREGGFGFHPMWRNIPSFLRRVDVAAVRGRVGG